MRFYSWFIQQNPTWKATWLGILTVSFLLVLIAYLSRNLWLNSASSFITAKDTSCPADAIVIEGWGYPNEPSIRTSFQLLSSGFGKTIFLTEYFPTGSSHLTGTETSKDYQKMLDIYSRSEGVEPERVKRISVRKKRPVTWNTALTVTEAFAARGYNSMILVSHWHHSRRSCDAYAKAGEEKGIKVYCKPVECGLGKDNWWESLSGWSTVFGEIVERLYYLLFL
jgi:hypothetical protein